MTSLAPLRRAEILAVGTELTIGSTRDTNSARLAAELSARGVEVTRITALPDRLGVVREGFEAAIGRADLVISTGGLGPTPDDLTRESIAAACGREPYVDAFLERWLRELFHRRGLAMAEANLKQAWLIEGATALANHQGTAPGWWVEPDDLHVIVAMPGPPREMWPMWHAAVLPRLESRGLGQESAAETLRLSGIGESALADLIGESILRARDPEVATYARADAVDVRISSFGSGADARVAAMRTLLEQRLTRWIFARGDATWVDALEARLAGRTLAAIELGSDGQLAALLASAPWFVRGEVLPGDRRAAAADPGVGGDAEVSDEDAVRDDARSDREDLRRHACRIREAASADVGIAIRAYERRGDTAVSIAISVGAQDASLILRTAFLNGSEGRRRAALLACAELWQRLSD